MSITEAITIFIIQNMASTKNGTSSKQMSATVVQDNSKQDDEQSSHRQTYSHNKAIRKQQFQKMRLKNSYLKEGEKMQRDKEKPEQNRKN